MLMEDLSSCGAVTDEDLSRWNKSSMIFAW